MSVDLYIKALNSVRAARDSLDDHRPDDAVSRAYYAMFNAARAFLHANGVKIDESSHGAIVQLFGLHAIKTGKVPAPFGQIFNRLQEGRAILDLMRNLFSGMPAYSIRGPSSKEKADRKLRESLAFAFCRALNSRGRAVPDGLEEKLIFHGADATLSRLLADLPQMNDLQTFLSERLPNLKL